MKEQILDWYKSMGFNYWKLENQNSKLIASMPVQADGKNTDPNGEKLLKELSRLETMKATGNYTVSAAPKNGTAYNVQTFTVGTPDAVPMMQSFSSPKSTNPNLFGLEMAMLLGRRETELAIQPLQMQLLQKEKEIEDLKKKPQESEGLGLGNLISEGIKQAAPEVIKQVMPTMIKGFFDLANKSDSFRKFFEKITENEVVQQGVMQAAETYFKSLQQDGSNTD